MNNPIKVLVGPSGFSKTFGKFTSQIECRISPYYNNRVIWRWIAYDEAKIPVYVIDTLDLWDLRSIAQDHCVKARARSISY